MPPIRTFFQSSAPPEYRANFIHLYLDIGWFGVLSGSAVNFLNIYAARLGATGFQIGLLAAVSGVVNLLFAIPAGRWLERLHIGRAVFWTSVFYRLGYAMWIPLPWLFSEQEQVWALILITLYMGIPLTALSVGFNALFAAAVPEDWRAHVAGRRNAVLSIAFVLTSLVSGYLLEHFPFPMNYQIIFGVGFFGAAMSSFHLYFVKPLQAESPPPRPRPASGSRDWRATVRLDIWKTAFRRPLLVLLGFHLTQYLPLPLFSIYFVRGLHLTDDEIGIGMALFYLTVFLGSTQLNRVVRRLGHKNVTTAGALTMAFYPGLLALSSHVWHYYTISALGGFAWALVGGAYANYLLEKTPTDDRPSHLAWYNVMLNAAVLIGSLAGPALASQIGLSAALVLFGVLRLLSGWAIWKWG